MNRAWMAFWPGLAALWLRGSWLGLACAVLFTAALQFALVTTFVWPQILSRQLPAWAMPAAAWVSVLWLGVVGRRSAARILASEAAKSLQPDAEADALLAEAQTEYLKGHWMEAQAVLSRLLIRRPGDAEARLLLASVYRRSGQPAAAADQLALLAELPRADRWREEISAEMRLLARDAAQGRASPMAA